MNNTRFISFICLLLTSSTIIGVYAGNNSFSDEYLSKIPFKISKVATPVFPEREVSIEKFGAKGDGTKLNTEAIQNAINNLHEKGGGYVLVPEGIWLTGPIELKSNICLKIKKEAVLLFTRDFNQYSLKKTYYEGTSCWRAMSPLYACNAVNIAIIGEGIINGSGDAWRPVKSGNVNKYQWSDLIKSGGLTNPEGSIWYPTKGALAGSMSTIKPNDRSYEQSLSIKEWLRPVLVNLISCKNVLIDGTTFLNSPAWCLHPLMCENLTIRNVIVKNDPWAANGDAIDLESCKNVFIESCRFDAGDDGICMKSGKDEEGRKRGIPTENVVIKKCLVLNGHGGFVVGSEMSGGVRNVFVDSCTFIGTDNGLRFKSTRGRGGLVENIYVNNVYMVEIKSDAIIYDLYYFNGDKNKEKNIQAGETTPCFKNIHMKNIFCNGAKRAALFQGLPEMKLMNISLSNAVISADNGIFCNDAVNIILKNVTVKINGQDTVYYDNKDISQR